MAQRIRIKFINDSMMAQSVCICTVCLCNWKMDKPLVDMPNKHTLIVPPGKTVTALRTADELGEWAIHCHSALPHELRHDE